MSEELTTAMCPDSGVAEVMIVVEWKAAKEAKWRLDGPFSDFIGIMPQQDCQHLTTVCRECLETWAIDYIVTLAPPGTPVPPLIEE